MRKYGNTYIISINENKDIDLIEDEEEREELEELIDAEITEVQEQIENWCKEYKADYDLLQNHRCIVTTHCLYTDEIFPSTLKAIEDNLLNETYINFDIVEE